MAFNQGKTAALNMLGRDVPHEVVPYFFSCSADWGELEYVGPAYDGTRRSCAAARGRQLHELVSEGRAVVKAALTFGKPDDLEHAKRLIVGAEKLEGGQKRMLADEGSDLADVK